MGDQEIITLFWQRSEAAVAQSQRAYGAYCLTIANHILADCQDAKECVNDTWLRAWNAIPPQRPGNLSAFLGRITRNLALDRYNDNTAAKRSTALTDAFEEMEFCLTAGRDDPEAEMDAADLRRVLNDFLRRQTSEARIFFLRRYWYGERVREIAENCHVSEGKVKSSLFRTRERLRAKME